MRQSLYRFPIHNYYIFFLLHLKKSVVYNKIVFYQTARARLISVHLCSGFEVEIKVGKLFMGENKEECRKRRMLFQKTLRWYMRNFFLFTSLSCMRAPLSNAKTLKRNKQTFHRRRRSRWSDLNTISWTPAAIHPFPFHYQFFKNTHSRRVLYVNVARSLFASWWLLLLLLLLWCCEWYSRMYLKCACTKRILFLW